MSDRPTSHDCGYVDGKPGEVVWSGRQGRCTRCGKQYEDDGAPDLLGTGPTA